VNPFVILGLVFVPMIAESALSLRNERIQRARGGVEPPDDVYRTMRWLYPAGFALMIAESILRGGAPAALARAGLGAFVASKAFKWWAMASLGDAWTFRVIVVPEATLVRTGPYRFMRHPNYAAVAGELVAIALLSGATLAGPIVTTAFVWLISKRIVVEERALKDARRR
jgi:methyltransferase